MRVEEDRRVVSRVQPLVVVSHRLPVVAGPGGAWQRAPGGLVSALEPALSGRPSCWFGHVSAPLRRSRVGGLAVAGIQLRRRERVDAIDGYANRTLWPALHGILGNIEQRPEWLAAYRARAAKTARLLAAEVDDGATVWLHDYQMFGVAGDLAAARPDLDIGLFCHTPIVGDALAHVDGIAYLAASVGACCFVGTQTTGDRAALAGVLAASGVDPPSMAAVPVAIDHARWTAFRSDPVVAALAARAARPAGLLAVGVDRVDYSKGLTHKLLAVELLLDNGVVGPDDLRLVQIAVPSRVDVPVYRFVADQVRETADRVNRRFRRSDGLPVVDVRWEQFPPREVAGLMRAADLALITPVRDGMNLVALEFSVLNGDRPCEVVLGSGAGAANVIGPWSTLVDGSDVLAIAASISAAVSSSRETWPERSAARARAASRRSSSDWASDVLERLRRAGARRCPDRPTLDVA